MSLAMEPSPFQKFRDIIEFNYSPKEERELDEEADEIFEDLDYQNSKRFEESLDWDTSDSYPFNWEDPPELSL